MSQLIKRPKGQKYSLFGRGEVQIDEDYEENDGPGTVGSDGTRNNDGNIVRSR